MNNSKYRGLSILVSVAVVSTLLSSVRPYDAKAEEKSFDLNERSGLLETKDAKVKEGDTFAGHRKIKIDDENTVTSNNPEETVRVIVELAAKPASQKAGSATKATKSMINNIINNQSAIKNQVKKIADSNIKNTFGNLINGFSIDVKRKNIKKIKEIKGVEKVTEAKVFYPTMTSAKELTEVKDVWENYKYKGEGLVAAIIDTGIDYTHKDMKSPSNIGKIKIKKSTYDTGKYFTDKVPYGYNFADKNNEVIDKSGSMHGMHVAGIVAADGSKEEVNNGEAIQGVAPEAQLLAMKVFSNNAKNQGAFSDDIVAAIEKSVELKADVINMSLGSSAGFTDSTDPEQKAVKEAADAGVICIISAGNSSYSTSPYILKNQKDIGTTGTPGNAEDAIQVASSENTKVENNAITISVDGNTKNIGFTQCSINPSDRFKPGEKLQVVDCGYGDASDFKGKDLKGKVALVERGKINFTVKQNNAQDAGAAAVIVYNNQGESFISMQSDASLDIPALFISQSNGEALASHENSTVEFDGKTVVTANTVSEQMSDFTSWGPTPDLEFAPEVTAPGGNIFSTVNDNRYTSMSGTSMAAPHTTGVAALVLEAIKDKKLELSGKNLVSYVKNSLINTAKILYDKESSDGTVPYSPRRQGAGLIQARNAIDNNVAVLADDGQATVSLKEIGNNTDFNITLKNYGDKSETYSIETPGGVLTSKEVEEDSDETMSSDTVLNGAKLTFDKQKVTVPAKGNVKIKATLNIDSSVEKNNYAEGYISLKNENNDPSLVIPYMGFYGDWSAERIVSPMEWDKESDDYYFPSFAQVSYKGDYNYAGFDKKDEDGNVIINENNIAISPNKDDLNDTIVPSLYLLRNAKSLSVDILDKDKKVISKNIGKDEKVSKKIISEDEGQTSSLMNDLSWNGYIYNISIGDNQVVPDGQYYMNIRAKADLNKSKEQETIIPVKVDTKAPEITMTSPVQSNSESYKLSFTINENNSGLNKYKVLLNDKEVTAVTYDNVNYTAELMLEKNAQNYIEIVAKDNAENISDETFEVSTIYDKTPVLFSNLGLNEMYTDKDQTINGRVTDSVAVLKIAGQNVKINDNKTFSVALQLNEGLNTVSVYAEDKSGKELVSYGIKVFCDVTAPVIIMDSAYVSDGVINTASHNITLKGKVSDNVEGYKLYINGEQILVSDNSGKFGAENNEKEFTKDLVVNNGDIVTLRAEDSFGNKTVQKYTVKINPSLATNTKNVSDGKIYNQNVLPEVKYDADAYNVTATLNGKPYKDGQPISEEGEYTLIINSVLKGEDSLVGTQTFKFTIDKTAPMIKVDGMENGKLYNKDVEPVITVEQGATVTEMTLDGKEYDEAVVTTDGTHKLVIKAVDKAGNETKYEEEFTIDKTAPEITVEGVQDVFKYEKEVTPVVKVNEKTSELTVTLDGKAYDGKAVNTDGKHVLKVEAVDLAGNKSEKTVTFTVNMPKPANQKPDPSKKPGNTQNKPGSGSTVKTNDDNAVKKPAGSTTNANNSTAPTSNVNMPNTGSVVNTTSMIVVALLMIAAGASVVFTKRKKRL